LKDLSAIAVATRPGLVGSLLVGLTAAKTLAAVLNVPLIAVDHIEGHIYACRMVAERNVFPAVGLVVSGGHTNLYDCRTATDFELIGCTTDDAAGEAFDKVARILRLPYPGGPAIQNAAETGDPQAFAFPRSFIRDKRLDFSFSGLKTAVLYKVQGQPGARAVVEPMTSQRLADVAASFQEAVVDVLVAKSLQAVQRLDRSTLCVGGGVAANNRLREKLEAAAAKAGVELIIAPLAYCTDNAAMAAIAWELFEAGVTSPLDVDVVPGLVRARKS
jgi:N6-L-threonylcarbamoyladenine synthase